MQPKAPLDPLGFGGFSAQPLPMQRSMNPPKKKGFDFRSLISEGAGTGGALGGAAAGAAIGSVIPGLGTAIGGVVGAGLGGLLGGTGGKLAEDQIIDGKINVGNALGEGALSGVLGAGPLRLAKLARDGSLAARGASSALAPTANTLESALTSSAVQGAAQPLKTSFTGRLTEAGNKALESQYGTITRPVAKATNPTETISRLAKIGITKPQDAEKISMALTGSDGILTQSVAKAIGSAGKVNIDDITPLIQKSIVANSMSGLKNGKAIGDMVESNLQAIRASNGSPDSVIGVIRNLESKSAELLGKGRTYHLATSADKNSARAITEVTDALKDSLYNAAGANKNVASVLTPELRQQLISLKPKSKEWVSFVDNDIMKAKDIGALRSAQSPFVKISQIIDDADINSMTFGGRAGNFFNGQGNIRDLIAGTVIGGVKNPASRAAGTTMLKTADTLSSPISTPGALGIAGRNVGIESLQAGAGVAKGTSASALMGGQQVGASEPQTIEEMLMAQSGATPGMQSDPFSQQTTDPNAMQMQPTSQNPYSRENLLSDIQRDPQNAQKYIQYYQQLDEIFGQQEEELSTASAKAATLSDTGLGSLDTLETLFNESGGGSGAAGTLREYLPKTLDPSGRQYTESIGAYIPSILQAMGKTDAPSETELKGIIAALPKLNDSPQAAQIKLANLRRSIQAYKQNAMMYNGGGQSGGLEGALMQQSGGM